jgi:type I restriction enzyme S subunit
MNLDELQLVVDDLDDFVKVPDGVGLLKRAILDLAMLGLLAPQSRSRPDELEQLIARARVALPAQGSKVKDPGVARRWTSSEPPEGWLCYSIGEITSKIGSGSTPRGGKDAYVHDGPLFLRSQNVWNEGLRLDGAAHIPSEVHARMKGTHVRAGDVLLNITGASIGRSALVPDGIGEANVSQHVMIIRPILKELGPFLHAYVRSPTFQRMIDDAQVGISREGLSKQSVTGMPIALPPIDEQDRIVESVEDAFGLIDELEQRQRAQEMERRQLSRAALLSLRDNSDTFALVHLNELVDSYEDTTDLERTIIELGVRGRLTAPRPGDDESVDDLIATARSVALDGPALLDGKGNAVDQPYDLPSTWRWVPLGALLTGIQAGRSPTAQGRPKEGDEWGVLKVSACSWGEFRPDENKALRLGEESRTHLEVKDGDFLISRANTSQLVGRSVVVLSTPPRLMLSDKTLRLGVVDGCNARYLNLANLTEVARAHYEAEATGTSSSMKNVSQKAIRRTAIPLPSPAEQDRIVAIVDELVSLVRVLRLRMAA